MNIFAVVPLECLRGLISRTATAGTIKMCHKEERGQFCASHIAETDE